MTLFEVKNLCAYFETDDGVVKAVDGVGFEVEKGKTLGIVGESGSGKTVCQLVYLGLLPSPPLQVKSGEVFFRGKNILSENQTELRKIRGNRITMIFQEPMTSLNPYLKIGTQLMEPLQVHLHASKKEAKKEVVEALGRVGIADPQSAVKAYPHEFSGGMRQRVMIAMALLTKPDILVADEPTTALDVTVQAQILELLKTLQKETGMAIIFISHDLGVIASIADDVLVMYGGQVMEKGTVDEIFSKSEHPYTLALLKSTPRLDKVAEKLPVIDGAPPNLMKLNSGCPFYARCDMRLDQCQNTRAKAHSFTRSHKSYCHLERVSE